MASRRAERRSTRALQNCVGAIGDSLRIDPVTRGKLRIATERHSRCGAACPSGNRDIPRWRNGNRAYDMTGLEGFSRTVGGDKAHIDDAARWLEYRSIISRPSIDQRRSLPDFLVISPARTGSTWLAENLRRHPDILIPPEKEVRYFDTWWRRKSMRWYCSRFVRESARLAGDVSPTYSLLPSFAIEHIHSIKPNLKIAIVLREPTARAWSHLKHTRTFGEANFFGNAGSLGDVGADEMVLNLVHDQTLSSGDYEGIMRRWLRWFPKEQFHVAFFEEAIKDPKRYLTRLFAFLGVDSGVSLELVQKPVNKSEDARPNVGIVEWLEEIYFQRGCSFARFLERTFQLKLPWPDYSQRPGSHGPKRVPHCFDGRAIELSDGLFWDLAAKQGGQPNGDAARGQPFLGDLLRTCAPELFPAEAKLRDQDVSIEDLRLINVLDRLAEAAITEEDARPWKTLEGIIEERTLRLGSLEASLQEQTLRLAALERTMEERTHRLMTLEAILEERLRSPQAAKEESQKRSSLSRLVRPAISGFILSGRRS